MRNLILVAALAVVLGGCSKRNPASVAAVPDGAPVSQHRGAGFAATESTEASAPSASRTEIQIPKGASLSVRLDEAVNTRRNRPGDIFRATLEKPVVVEGETVIPAGAQFTGRVATADESGRLKGRAVLAVELESFKLKGKEYQIDTSQVVRQGEAHKKRNIEFIAGGSGLGAAIGAITGGGKGAATEALVGGAAGTGAAATGNTNIGLPAESSLIFSLQAPVRF
jgi:hypothetical protein